MHPEQDQGLDVLFGAPSEDADDAQLAAPETTGDKETSNTPNFYQANAHNTWSLQPTLPAAFPLAADGGAGAPGCDGGAYGGMGGVPNGQAATAGAVEGLMHAGHAAQGLVAQGLVADAPSPGQKEIALSTHPPVVCVCVCARARALAYTIAY